MSSLVGTRLVFSPLFFLFFSVAPFSAFGDIFLGIFAKMISFIVCFFHLSLELKDQFMDSWDASRTFLRDTEHTLIRFSMAARV